MRVQERESYEREREARQRLEEEKRELEREREEERESFRQQMEQLQMEKARLQEEKSQIEREELQQAKQVCISQPMPTTFSQCRTVPCIIAHGHSMRLHSTHAAWSDVADLPLDQC